MRGVLPFFGEFLGTFILVFIGCGSVAVDVLWGVPFGLFGVAFIWGIGVALAIYSTRGYSNSHLNPAVTVAMFIYRPFPVSEMLLNILNQLIGAFAAGGLLYLIFNSAITEFEATHQIIRGDAQSYQTSKMFGEFYHNYSKNNEASQPTLKAMIFEALGTFLLVFSIFILIHLRKINKNLIPALIGLTVAILIIFIAPITQAGLNPARDFGPRLISYLAGWDKAAFPPAAYGFFTVYILAPLIGGALATLTYKTFFKSH